MSPLKTSLIVAAVSAALTAGACYFVQHRRAQEIASLGRKNSQMLFQANQRRNAAATVDRLAAVPEKERSAVRPAEPGATQPAEVYRNEGRATPRATLQTFAWACDRGDAETVAKMLYFEGESRKKAEAFLATLPESTRAQWKSVGEMAAALLTYSNMERPFPNADILEALTIERISDDRAMLHMRGTSRDRTQFQKTGDVWKYVITEAAVDAYIAQASAAKPPAR